MSAKGYMCSVDYDEYLENDWHGMVPVYTSPQSIRHHRKCVRGRKKGTCGIYEVEIKVTKIVKKENI